MTRCSIVIPVFNHATVTRDCLNALLHDLPEMPLEIIVVDDASSDWTPRLLTEYRDRIRVVTLQSNSGFAIACNAGAAVANGEYVIFLNNDTLPQHGWLDELSTYADLHREVAIVGSKLLFPNDTIQHAGIVVCQDRFTRGIYTRFPKDHPAVNQSRRYQAVTGACMLIRRPIFEAVGGFDLAYLNAYEDHDLCLRVGETGGETHYCHTSVLYHLQGVTRSHREEDFAPSTRHFVEQWHHRLTPDDLDYYLTDGLIRLEYGQSFPIRAFVSPLLAVLDGDDRERQMDRLLMERARQVEELLTAQTFLSIRATESGASRTVGKLEPLSGENPGT